MNFKIIMVFTVLSLPWYISVNVSVLFILNTSDENSLFVYQAGWFMIFNFHGM